ncbi:flagellar basal body P-ring protein FlgI [Leptospirillum ferriphilum]|jgi:flagellar P-ring protein precursor FlgI|uniref:flagellar basal body P-ring protein FlgI n=1 Tax=Leptospirillum ferriphilum TaxID=178606 RepID=UPI003EE661CE
MKIYVWCVFAFLVLGCSLSPMDVRAERIEDIAHVEGVTDNPLVGYGLVVGLPGTGDTKMTPFTRRTLESALSRLGVHTRDLDQKIRGHNIAAVVVTGRLIPFLRVGSRMSVHVASIGDATSLEGGTLLLAALKGPDGKVYATAQGPVNTDRAERIGFPKDKKEPLGGRRTTGGVIDGGLVVRGLPIVYNGRKHLWINLNHSSFTTASRIVRAINAHFQARMAVASDAGTITVSIPSTDQDNVVGFMATVLNVRVTPDSEPLVVVNQQTGTIVISRDVSVLPCAVSQKDLTVQVGTGAPGKPSPGEPFRLVDRSVSLRQVVRALNLLGTRTPDLIAILEALKESGALKARIRVAG